VQLKTHIEALLFLTDKPLKAQAIARTLNQDVQVVRQAMLELINDYESRNGALEIADEDGYMMQVKDEFSSLVDEFSPFEMPTALVRTLSAIALKQPVSQADVIKIRGAGAYDHIKELELRELIHKREDGRSPILTTTKKFQEYFRLSKDGQDWRQELSTASKGTKAEGEDGGAGGDGAEGTNPDAVQLDVFDASPDGSAKNLMDEAPAPTHDPVSETEADSNSGSDAVDVNDVPIKELALKEVFFKEDSDTDKNSDDTDDSVPVAVKVESESFSH